MTEYLPRIRGDLEMVVQVGDKGRPSYLVLDPNSDEIYELSEQDHFICSRFDGSTPLDRIQSAFEEQFDVPLHADQLAAFVQQFQNMGLLAGVANGKPAAGSLDHVHRHKLFNAERWAGFLAALFGWCFTWPFLALLLLTTVLAFGVLVQGAGDLFSAVLSGVIPRPYFLLVPVFLLLIIRPLGEVAKAIACRHYGAQVYDFGFVLLYRLIPQVFADTSDAFWFLSKKEQFKIVLSGCLAQVFLTGICLIGWQVTMPGSHINNMWAIFAALSLVYVLLNFQPLSRRDGSLLLSIWTEKPKLLERSRAVAKSWLLGGPRPEPLTSREIRWFGIYGLLSIAYEFVFWALFLGFVGYQAMRRFEGVGAVFFLGFLCLRFESTLRRPIGSFFPSRSLLADQQGGVILKWIMWLGMLGVLILVCFLPYPFEAGGDFRLLPASQLGIRAQTAGEIQSVLIEEGQWVEAGQPAAILVGRDQRKRLEELQATQRDLKARLRLLKAGPKPEAIQVARQQLSSAKKSLKFSNEQLARHKAMYEKRAIPADQYEASIRMRDMDRERVNLAQSNLALVESGARDEEIEALEAEIARLEVSLVHAREELELTTLTSPAAGRVITPYLHQKLNQYLGVGELFAVVEDARNLVAEIEVPEKDIADVALGAKVTLRSWADPLESFSGEVTAIAPVAFEKSIKRIRRVLSDRESRVDQREIIREKGKAVRVLCKLTGTYPELKTDMTGYAKIESQPRMVGVAFTRWLVRFIMVEVWSWIP